MRIRRNSAKTGAEAYATLGLDRDATYDQARSAYKALYKEFHPDTAARDKARAAELTEIFAKISDAWSFLIQDSPKREIKPYSWVPAGSRPPSPSTPRPSAGRSYVTPIEIYDAPFGQFVNIRVFGGPHRTVPARPRDIIGELLNALGVDINAVADSLQELPVRISVRTLPKIAFTTLGAMIYDFSRNVDFLRVDPSADDDLPEWDDDE